MSDFKYESHTIPMLDVATDAASEANNEDALSISSTDSTASIQQPSGSKTKSRSKSRSSNKKVNNQKGSTIKAQKRARSPTVPDYDLKRPKETQQESTPEKGFYCFYFHFFFFLSFLFFSQCHKGS